MVRIPQLSPVQRFVLYSFIVVSILGLLLSWGLSYYVGTLLIRNSVQSLALAIQPMMSHELRLQDLRGPMSEARRREFGRLVAEQIRSERIARIKIWNREGMVIYSDDHTLIGRRFPVEGKLRRALDGEIAFDPSSLEKGENVAEKTFGQLLEIYVPLRVTEAKDIVGAYEVYAYWQPFSRQIWNVRYLVWGFLASGLALLYLLLFGVFRNAWRVILQQRDQMEAIYEANRSLAAELHLESLLQKLAQSAQKLVRARYAALGVFDEEGRISQFYTAGLTPEERARLSQLPQGRGMLGVIQHEGKPLRLDDIARHPRSYGFPPGHPPMKTFLGVPIISRGQVVGDLYLTEKEGGQPFSEEDQLIIDALAADAAMAIENARLYDETRRRLSELSALFEVSTALRQADTVAEMLPIILDKTIDVMGADTGALFLVDWERQELVLGAACGSLGEMPGYRVPRDEQLPWHCVLTNQPYVIRDVAAETLLSDGMKKGLLGLASGLCAPLATAEETVGTIEVFFRKPRVPAAHEVDLFSTLANLAANAIRRSSLHEELAEAYLQTVLALANAIDAKDSYTGGHGERLAVWAEAVARELGCTDEEIEQIRWGALLHDIGKIGVDDAILQKPGSLTDEEWTVMRQHPEIGARIVEPVKRLKDVAPIIRHHQERWDGTGYPDGLRGEAIPLGARILAVVDAYGAITDDRVYRKARSHDEAVAELRRCAGTQFDPQVVEAFLRVLEKKGSGGNWGN